MDVEVRSQDLPGLGKQFDIGCVDDGRISLVVRNNGIRDLHAFEPGADSASSVLQLTDAQARALGALLIGAYFRPSEVDEDTPVTFGGVVLDWPTVGTAAAGTTARELAPAVSLVAIVRGGETLLQPSPDEPLQSGDRLLLAGQQADVTAAHKAITAS